MTTANQSRALGILIFADPSVVPEILEAKSWDKVPEELQRRAQQMFEAAAGVPMDSDEQDEEGWV